jgi:hypothetical protein
VISSAIESTCEKTENSTQVELKSMNASEAIIKSVLGEFRNVTDCLVQSSSLLKNESIGIKSEVAEALVQLQFQDRVSQIMSHVKCNIERMPGVFAENRVPCPVGSGPAAGGTREDLRNEGRARRPRFAGNEGCGTHQAGSRDHSFLEARMLSRAAK